MPDKIYKKGCGRSCLRCWQNKLKFGSKLGGDVRTKDYNVYRDRKDSNDTYENMEDCDDTMYESYIMDRIKGLNLDETFESSTKIKINNKMGVIHLDDLYLDFIDWYNMNNPNPIKIKKKIILQNMINYIPREQMRGKIIYNVAFI